MQGDWDAFVLLGLGLIIGWMVGVVTKRRLAANAAGGKFKSSLRHLKRLEQKMAQRIEASRAAFAEYAAAVDAFVASVDAMIAKAVAADDAEEDTAIANLNADYAAAKERLPTPPVVEPPVEE